MAELEYTCPSCYRYTVVISDEHLLTEHAKGRIPTTCPFCKNKLVQSLLAQDPIYS